MKHDLSPRFMKDVFPQLEPAYNFRKDCSFKKSNINTVTYGIDTISYWGPRLWSSVPPEIRNANHLSEFKEKIKKWTPSGCRCKICKPYIYQIGYV